MISSVGTATQLEPSSSRTTRFKEEASAPTPSLSIRIRPRHTALPACNQYSAATAAATATAVTARATPTAATPTATTAEAGIAEAPKLSSICHCLVS